MLAHGRNSSPSPLAGGFQGSLAGHPASRGEASSAPWLGLRAAQKPFHSSPLFYPRPGCALPPPSQGGRKEAPSPSLLPPSGDPPQPMALLSPLTVAMCMSCWAPARPSGRQPLPSGALGPSFLSTRLTSPCAEQSQNGFFKYSFSVYKLLFLVTTSFP